MSTASRPVDQVVIVGAGLTGSLIALALRELRPEIRFTLIESAARCGGGPVPPFFSESVPLDKRWLIDSLIVRQWPAFAVAIPGFVRSFPGPVSMLIPEQLHAEVMQAIPQSQLRLGATAVHIDQSGVVLSDGQVVPGSVVIDARAEAIPAMTGTHWCHETSRLVAFPAPHDLAVPIVVDATLTAPDRTFLQYYPVDPHSLLIRYICYSRAGTNRKVSDVGENSNRGKLIAETRSRKVLLGRLDSPFQDISPSCVSARSMDAARWNPVMSDCVGAAVRVAAAFAAAMDISNAGLASTLSDLIADGAERRLQSSEIIESLCSEETPVQHHALRSLYGLGKDGRKRFESGTPVAEDFERLGELLSQRLPGLAELGAHG